MPKANLPETISKARELLEVNGLNFILEFATKFPSLAQATLVSPDMAGSFAAIAAIESAISVAIAKRHLQRCDGFCRTVVDDLTDEKLEKLAESLADLAVEMNEFFKKCKSEAYEEKLRYWAQLLHGQMDVETALKKDKYHRWKKWMTELDLIALQVISKIEPHIDNDDRFVNEHLRGGPQGLDSYS